MSERNCLLVGDIGGTHARFALASAVETRFDHERTYSCADFPGAEMAIEHYTHEFSVRPEIMCLAAAGPVRDGIVTFTNNDWVISESALAEHFGGVRAKLLNDFEAVAYSVPLIEDKDLLQVGPRQRTALTAPNYTLGIVGPGTGLGVAGLCRRRSELWPIMGEGGHLGFAPASSTQRELLRVLSSRFSRVSNERLLSGPGLENIYAALAESRSAVDDEPSAAEIFACANADSSGLHAQAVALFFEILGQVAGDVALLLGAADGMYIAGGIVQRYPQLLLQSGFRDAFESKGRHRELMTRIPTVLILDPNPGLLGASYFALQLARGGQ